MSLFLSCSVLLPPALPSLPFCLCLHVSLFASLPVSLFLTTISHSFFISNYLSPAFVFHVLYSLPSTSSFLTNNTTIHCNGFLQNISPIKPAYISESKTNLSRSNRIHHHPECHMWKVVVSCQTPPVNDLSGRSSTCTLSRFPCKKLLSSSAQSQLNPPALWIYPHSRAISCKL